METLRKKAIGLSNSGSIKNMEGSYWEAIELFTKAYETDPGFLEALLNRANAKVNAGRFEDASKDFELIVEKRQEDL